VFRGSPGRCRGRGGYHSPRSGRRHLLPSLAGTRTVDVNNPRFEIWIPVSSILLRRGCFVLRRDGRRLCGRQVCTSAWTITTPLNSRSWRDTLNLLRPSRESEFTLIFVVPFLAVSLPCSFPQFVVSWFKSTLVVCLRRGPP
jgi:hypothetical protein